MGMCFDSLNNQLHIRIPPAGKKARLYTVAFRFPKIEIPFCALSMRATYEEIVFLNNVHRQLFPYSNEDY